MDCIIRKIEKRDFEAILPIFREIDLLHFEALPQIFNNPGEESRSQDFLSGTAIQENSVLFVAESNNQIVGLIEVSIRESSVNPVVRQRKYAYIGTIVVTEQHRRSGIGRQLMKTAEQWASEKSVSQVEFNVWDFNHNALGFFEKLGYSPSRHILSKDL